MKLDAVKQELGADWKGFGDALKSAVKSENPLLTRINDYLLDNAGKQLRPVLCLLSAKACGIVSQMSYDCAAVCEIIHTATLLHDDVADNGDVRRGVPTVKAVFAPAASVLTGDYWLSRGLHTIVEKSNSRILALFTKALEELSYGEIIQMDKAEKLDTSLKDYYRIIECKTASLFRAAVKSGAISAGADDSSIEAMSQYAYHLGVAFQMRDDIFDYSPKMDTGKVAGADIKERKITLPLLCAFEGDPTGEKQIRRLIDGIENTVTKGETITEEDHRIIAQVNEYVNRNSGIGKAQQILEKHVVKAKEALWTLSDTPSRKRLVELAEFVAKRES